ncbi:hypothetical protein ACQVTX_23700 [Bacillus pretiosus]|uniref:hypothetical protein n=1 Tax=Bacillus pretiosus TaxID=2983392 RepID=UPI003D656D36
MKPKFKIKSEAKNDLPHLSFLYHINEVIIISSLDDGMVLVVDIDDGIEFRVHQKYLEMV